MAASKDTDTQTQAPERPLVWQEKLEKGEKLNHLEGVRSDADFLFHQRVKEQAEREEQEARKAGQNRPE